MPFARNALVDSYGLTECSTAIAVAVGAELEEFPGTLGRPIITVSMEIRDPFGEWLPDGIEGEVCVRSPFVMLGYWENDEATESAIAPGRWLRTGDFGVIENGRLRLTGRRSDLILRGGENVYPAEVEQALAKIGVRLDQVLGQKRELQLVNSGLEKEMMNDPALAGDVNQLLDYKRQNPNEFVDFII
mgnify:CR=1 FL=1